MNASYIITHRGKVGSRFNNLIFVLDWLSDLNINIVLVEQDNRPYLADLNLSYPGVDYVFAYNDGLFNRSWGFNIGFKYARGNVVAFSDSDIFMNLEELKNAFQECEQRYDAVNPYAQIVDMTESDTKDLLENPGLIDRCKIYNDGPKRGYTVFCGGLVLFKRKAFETLGGFDERFVGWGGEDDALSFVLAELVQNRCEMPYTAYHLWHERTTYDGEQQPNILENRRLVKEYPTLTRSELLLQCESFLKSMGDPDKYKPADRVQVDSLNFRRENGIYSQNQIRE